MNHDVQKLWELQQVLTQLAEKERQLTVKPESFAAVDQEWQAANEEMTKIGESVDVLARERRRVDGELSDQQELLKKYQGQLMQVKNQQQYAAAWKEIDATRKHVKELEESALKNMSEVDALQNQLAERKGGHDALKARYDSEHDAWQSSLGDLRDQVDKLKQQAAQIEKGIPEPAKREFYRVFKQRQGIAVAEVIGDSCAACRTRVRPQVMQQLKRGERVVCEGCSRILYWEKPAS